MKKKVLLVLGLLLALGASAWAQTLERVDRVSNSGFDKTVRQLEVAIKGKGMMVVAVIDHQNLMRMVGTNIRGSKTLEFGKPDMSKMTLGMAPETGLEMPAKVYVFERGDGKTVVSYYKPSGGFATYRADSLRQVGQMMDQVLAEIAAEGTR